MCEAIDLVQMDGINLIDDIETSQIDAIPFDDINELIDGDILTNQNVAVVTLVQLKNITSLMNINVG